MSAFAPKSKLWLTASTVAALLCFFSLRAQALELVQNGGFETGSGKISWAGFGYFGQGS